MLVIPEVRRRDDRAGLPIDLPRIVRVAQAVLAKERKPFAIERQDDCLIGMAMAELVSRHWKLRHVRLENRVARHFPKDALVPFAALFPRNRFGAPEIGDVVRLPPALVRLRRGRIEIRLAVEAFGEFGLGVLDESEIAKNLDHEGERSDCENARRMRRVVIEVTMNGIERHCKKAALGPRNSGTILRLSQARVAASL